MPITLRNTKGAPLTHDELDINFTHFFYEVAVTGSLVRFYRAQFDSTDSNPDSSVSFPVNPPAGLDKHIQVRYGNDLSGSNAIFTSSADYTFDYVNSNLFLTGSNYILGNQSVDGDVAITGDIDVQGTVTAKEFKTLIQSSQILVSGSTIFGDDNTDTHSFTGSVNISNNLEVSNGTFSLGSIVDVESSINDSETNLTALSSSASTERTQHSSSLANSITSLSSSASTERTQHSSSLASSITSLSSSAAITYLKNTSDTLTGDLTVTGNITAQEFHTEYVSASITYASGSNKFGDTADDVHSFTGSVNINGTVTANSINATVTGSIDNAISSSYILGSNVDGTVSTSQTASYISAINIDGTVQNSSTASYINYANIDNTPTIPTDNSELTNGAGYTTYTSNQATDTTSDVQFDSLGIGTAAPGTAGEIRATGDIIAYYSSDQRLKDNITPISDAVNKLNQIGGYEFDWNSNSSHSGHDVGVIAQEIEKVLPEVVTTRDNGYMAVRYEKIVALLIQAVKEQQLQIDELKSKL